MTHSDATFEVAQIFELASSSAMVLRGHIKAGVVVPGMLAKVWVDGGLYMTASIKSVEYIDGLDTEGTIGLVLQVPDDDTRKWWLGLCQAGDVLSIEVSKRLQREIQSGQVFNESEWPHDA